MAKNSILVVGATGALGRQVVRRALDEGYEVRCIVRPRMNPADFLRDWGATTVQADLLDPSSLPATLVGISAIIDCATARPEEDTYAIDWEGKVALIQCAQAMGIQRYLFMSIFNCDKHPQVPLMNMKACTEEYLKSSGLNYTILRLCGFMQVGPAAVVLRLHTAAAWCCWLLLLLLAAAASAGRLCQRVLLVLSHVWADAPGCAEPQWWAHHMVHTAAGLSHSC